MSTKNNKPKTANLLLVVTVAIVVIVSIVGYSLNIISVIGMQDVTSGIDILRVIGVIAPPIGAIMGLFV